MDGDTHDFFRSIYGPRVSIVSSTDADNTVSRNGLSIKDFFGPFLNVTGDVTSRDGHGNTNAVSKMKIHFEALNSSGLADDELRQRLKVAVEQNTTPGQDQIRLESGIYNLSIPNGCAWYNHYREIYLHYCRVEPHERLLHYMSTLLIVSSESYDPMSEFRKLSDLNRVEQNKLQELKDDERSHFWFSNSTQVLFLLLHDVHNGSEAKAQEVYANLKQTFGENNSYLLRINSDEKKSLDPWKGYLSRLNPLKQHELNDLKCGVQDQIAIRDFVKEFTIKGLIPHMEREAGQLAEIIQNKKTLHRSFFTATRKLFSSNQSKTQMPEKISDSVHVQIRKLADLQFILQQYQKAAENYSYAKREMSNEQNWIEATSAAEMSAIAVFMSGATNSFSKQVSSHAINSYINCNRPKLAIKCAMTTVEAVRSVGANVDAAKDFLKFVNHHDSLLISLFTEQAAICYLKARFPRQFAFQSILAGYQYKISQQIPHSIRNYHYAQKIIQNKGWKQAELHVYEIIGAYAAGDNSQAENNYHTEIALKSGTSLNTVQNYRRIMFASRIEQENNGDQSPRYPFVKIDLFEISVGGNLSERVLDSGNPKHYIKRIRALEHQCCRAIFDGIIPMRYTGSFPSTKRNEFTKNYKCLYLNIDEEIFVTVTLQNQLSDKLQLSDLKLYFSTEFDLTQSCGTKEGSLILNPHSEQQMVFTVQPKMEGNLVLKGIEYSLAAPFTENSASIFVRQDFDISKFLSPRKKSGDESLQISVIKTSPRIQFGAVPSLRSTVIAGEIVPFQIEVKNVGNVDAKNVWLNSNQCDKLAVKNGENCHKNFDRLLLSSAPEMFCIGDILPGQSKMIDMQLHASLFAEKNICDVMVCCKDDTGNDSLQTDAFCIETDVVASMNVDVTVRDTSTDCNKRTILVSINSNYEEIDYSQRYEITDCIMISNNWIISSGQTQPVVGLGWARGQFACSGLFVEAAKNEIPSSVEESVVGKRPWRRNLEKKCRITNCTNQPIEKCFLSNCIDFHVPKPTPEDDVIQHYWMDNLSKENISIIFKWKAKLIDGEEVRNVNGQHWTNLKDIYNTQSPLRCYLDAPTAVNHTFPAPCYVSCSVFVENTTLEPIVDAVLSFQHTLDSVAGIDQNKNSSFIWSGISEKKIEIPATKTIVLNNMAIFTRPGTFGLANFDIYVNEMKIRPKTHMITVNDT